MLIVIALTASARWETVMWDGKPMTSTLTIYRSDHNTTTKFIYDYRDSTFHVQFYPEARVLAKFKNYMDITPSRPAYVQMNLRFKGCDDGKNEKYDYKLIDPSPDAGKNEKYDYKLIDPSPDAGEVVNRGYFDLAIKDDGNILSHMRSCKKMQVRYFDMGYRRSSIIDLTLKDFEADIEPKNK